MGFGVFVEGSTDCGGIEVWLGWRGVGALVGLLPAILWIIHMVGRPFSLTVGAWLTFSKTGFFFFKCTVWSWSVVEMACDGQGLVERHASLFSSHENSDPRSG